MADYSINIGFTNEDVSLLLRLKTLNFTGSLKPHQYNQTFRTENSVVKLEPETKQRGKFNLVIDELEKYYYFP